MIFLKLVSILSLAFFFISDFLPSLALTGELTGVQVLNLVKAQESWEDEDAHVTFLMVNKKEKQVVRSGRRLRKNYKKGSDLLRKTLLIFRDPKTIYGIAFLDWYNRDINNPHSIWMYLPRLRRTRRTLYQEDERFLKHIFWGTNFTYGDLLERHLERDDHRIVGTETLNYKECFVIESIPRELIRPRKPEPYNKTISWVWKDNWVLLKRDFYDSDGVLIKTLTNHWAKKGEYWALKQSLMKHHRKDHLTVITIKNVKYNTQLADSLFHPAQLEYSVSFYK
jgi:outer membrane lipoprotein-sorting protein